MDHGLATTFCSWTLGQIGWIDGDGDGPLDPIDHPDSGSFLQVGVFGELNSGDYVDIRLWPGLDWVKRFPITRRSLDHGAFIWDGLNFAGIDATPPQNFFYEINGSGHREVSGLNFDTMAPVLHNVTITGDTYPGPFTLSFDLEDNDTRGCYVRARAYGDSDPNQVVTVFTDEFKLYTLIGGTRYFPVIEREFDVAVAGNQTLDLLVWDIGGGHNASVSVPFVAGNVTGVSQTVIPSLKLSPGIPNPFRAAVHWEVQMNTARRADMSVISVTGRKVRDFGELGLREGVSRILWDGRDDSGQAVAAGKYFLQVRLEGGETLTQDVVLIR